MLVYTSVVPQLLHSSDSNYKVTRNTPGYGHAVRVTIMGERPISLSRFGCGTSPVCLCFLRSLYTVRMYSFAGEEIDTCCCVDPHLFWSVVFSNSKDTGC